MIDDIERKTLLIASFLLKYPDHEWFETLEEVISEANEIVDKGYIAPILRFLEFAKPMEELDLAELYVRTFDFAKDTNLYLTYYSVEDEKKRGTEMVKLKQRYIEEGLFMSEDELPDFLPVVLEFASVLGASSIIKEFAPSIEKIYNNLSRKGNPYSGILLGILSIIKSKDFESELKERTMDYASFGGGNV